MKYEELQWESRDALELYTQKWEPENDIKGVICLVHGLGEHNGRYLHWAEKLVDAGYAALISDLRGHGKSGGQRGHTPSFDHYADDVSILLEAAAGSYPGKPVFLYGHSLGGLIVLYYLVQRRPEITGAVVTGPALHSAVAEQKVKVFLARLLGSIAPAGSMPSGLEQEAISSDLAVVETYRKDPLVHDRVSFGFGKQSLQAIDYVFNNASRINLPLLIMHGTDDRLAYASGVKELAELLPGDYTLKLWEGLYHEIHNETEQDEVFTYLKKWLDSKL
jgi:alpha-beta hydrolase superfamily lysophospholipase